MLDDHMVATNWLPERAVDLRGGKFNVCEKALKAKRQKSRRVILLMLVKYWSGNTKLNKFSDSAKAIYYSLNTIDYSGLAIAPH